MLFTAASVAVPIPLFPGNMISSHLEMLNSKYTPYLGALTNGLTYGFVTWIIFYLVDKRMEKAVIDGY
jgi:predicted acyltransferase